MTEKTRVSLPNNTDYQISVNSDKTICLERSANGSDFRFVANVPNELVPAMAKLINDDSSLPSFKDLTERWAPGLSSAFGSVTSTVAGGLRSLADKLTGSKP